MHSGRQPFFSSLAFKVGIIIVLAEMVILGITGTFYIYNFNTEIDRQIASNVLRPGALMNQGLLKLDVVTDAGYMHDLVGEELINAFVIGVNGNIFYSMNKEYTGHSAGSVPLIDSNLLSPNLTNSLVRQNRQQGRVVALTPLFGVDGRSLRFFAYIEASTAVAVDQKSDNVWLFVLGSLAVVGLTSIAILVGFNRTIFIPLQQILSAFRQAEAGELPKRLSLADSRDELGELARVFNRMATRLQKTQEKLQRERDLLRRVTETSPVGITVVDCNGQVTFANTQSEKVLGLSKDSIRQRTYNAPAWRITDEDGHPFPDEALPFRRVMATHRPVYDVRHVIVWPEGRRVLLSINAAPLLDAAGEVSGVVCTIEDITDRKAAEEALHNLNLDLDRRISERTAQLEAANKELEAFAYSASHDLRAPLRHIDGFLELLEKKVGAVLDEQGRHYMNTIAEASQKMGSLIDNLLDFSRMGRHAMALQEVDLDSLAHDVISELAPDADGRDIHWHVDDLPAVKGDVAMLRVVLTNLIANAVKFTQPREKARIEIGSQPGQNADTVIYVRDNGVGFDMAYVDKLFGVFQRLHRAEEFEGTGIGLANVRRIIVRHGGRAWAEGELDHGATFFLSLPRMGART